MGGFFFGSLADNNEKKGRRDPYGEISRFLLMFIVASSEAKAKKRKKVAKFHCLLLLLAKEKNLRAVLVSTLYPILRIKNSSCDVYMEIS